MTLHIFQEKMVGPIWGSGGGVVMVGSGQQPRLQKKLCVSASEFKGLPWLHQQSAWSRTSCYAVHRIISSKCALQNTVASFFDSFELQIKNKAEKLILEERL